jgi:transposase
MSLSSVKRYAGLARRGGSLSPGKGSGRPPKIEESAKKLLEKDVEVRSAATVSERRHFLERVTGESLSDSTVGRLLKRMGFSQKRSVGSVKKDEFLRAARRIMVAGRLYASRLMFVDGLGANTALAPICAWSRRGEQARCSMPRNRAKNTTILASITV